MINYDSIISAYNDKPTLMEWLKKVEEALKGASATSFSVNKKGAATISFQIDFDDGTSLESGEIILQQGESVTGASIVNGHLILTLSNGDSLDAGNLGAVSSFSIDGSQHLIVNYQDGTSDDLGAIFNGNVNISGVLTASSVSTPELTTSAAKIDVLKPIEVAGAAKATTLEQTQPNHTQTFAFLNATGLTITNVFNALETINGILHVVINLKLKNETGEAKSIGGGWGTAAYVGTSLPSNVGEKIIDLTGVSIHEAGVTGTIVTSTPLVVTKGTSSSSSLVTYNSFRLDFCNFVSVDGCSFNVQSNTQVTLNPDEEIYITGRMALTLI